MALTLPTNSTAAASTVNTLILGEAEIDVAGASDVTLSESQARHRFLIFSGALTGNISVILPAESKEYWVFNETTGAYTLTVKKSGGTGVAVTQSKNVLLAYLDYAGDVVALTAEL